MGDERLVFWFLGGVFVVGLAATPVIVLVPIALSVWRRSRWLDGIFGPLGLHGSLYMLRGRRYRGTVQGREVDIRFYQGPTPDMYVTTPLMTRFGAAKSAVIPELTQALDRQPLVLDDPALSRLSVFATDADWTRIKSMFTTKVYDAFTILEMLCVLCGERVFSTLLESG